VQAKTKSPGKQADIDAGHVLKFSKENIHLTTRG
jgi:N6-adenosine-specific RNA methylase IME4